MMFVVAVNVKVIICPHGALSSSLQIPRRFDAVIPVHSIHPVCNILFLFLHLHSVKEGRIFSDTGYQ